MLEWIGWVATVMFAASYLCRRDTHLRFVQALAALLWISYGIMIGALPVVVANSVVAVMAFYSAWRQHAGAAAPTPTTES